MKKLILKLGVLIRSWFRGTEKAYNKLPEAVKLALKQSAGITAIINNNLDEDPDSVLVLIEGEYPELGLDKIEGGIKEIGDLLEIDADISVTGLLGLIMEKLKTLKAKKGKFWANFSDTLAKTFAIFLSPEGTKAGNILGFIMFVYHRYIKKDE